jgi:hypothetical protein
MCNIYMKLDLICERGLPRFLSRTAQHLSMNEGSLVCSDEIHETKMLQIVFLVSLEGSQPGGVHGLSSVAFGLWCKSS